MEVFLSLSLSLSVSLAVFGKWGLLALTVILFGFFSALFSGPAVGAGAIFYTNCLAGRSL